VPAAPHGAVRRFLTETLGLKRANLPGALRLVRDAFGQAVSFMLMLCGAVALAAVVGWLTFPRTTDVVVSRIMTAEVRRDALAIVITLAALSLFLGAIQAVAEALDRRRHLQRRRPVGRRGVALGASPLGGELRDAARDLRAAAADLRAATRRHDDHTS
jgi:hypothetical protein